MQQIAVQVMEPEAVVRHPDLDRYVGQVQAREQATEIISIIVLVVGVVEGWRAI